MDDNLTGMSGQELEELALRISEERSRRRCPQFLPGQSGCERGMTPHEEHRCESWDIRGRKIVITWRLATSGTNGIFG